MDGPNLKLSLAVQLLLLILLVLTSSHGACAARPGPQERALLQLSATNDGGAAPPQPATEMEAGPSLGTEPEGPSPVCAALVDELLGSCSISADRIALTYSRGSEEPPTAEEQAAAIAALEGAGLPPRKCVPGWLRQRCVFCSCSIQHPTNPIEPPCCRLVAGAARLLAPSSPPTASAPLPRWPA